MKSISLYNQDGSLCSEAQLLVSSKPDTMSIVQWRKRIKEFKESLTVEELVLFNKLKSKVWDKKYYKLNLEQSKNRSIKWQKENSHKRKTITQRWYKNHAEKCKQNTREWNINNPEKRKAGYKRRHTNRQEAGDFLYSAKLRLRQAVYDSFKRIGKNKPTNSLKLLGCTWKEAKAHIENLWQEGMSWDNRSDWHIDHIRPVSSFREDELHLMNRIENLQPLWAKDNLLKGDKFDQEFIL